jgi:hypothetical protein
MTGPRLLLDDYQGLIDQDKAAGAAALKTSMTVANRQPTDPERFAKVLTLAGQAKLPVGVVERNYDQVAAAEQSKTTDYQSIIDSTPGLSEWLRDPHNAQLARNEVPHLQQVDRGARLLSYIPDVEQAKRDAVGASMTGLADLDASAAQILVAFGRISPEAAAAHVAAANRDAATLRALQPDYAKEFAAAMDKHAGDVDKAAREFAAYQGSERRQMVMAVLRGISPVTSDVAGAATNPDAAKTVGRVLSLIGAAIARPRGLAYQTIEQLTGSLPALGGGYAGAVAGGVAGSVVPVVGTAAGSAAGMAAGTFLGAAPITVGADINAELQKRGVDITDQHSLLTAFNDPSLMAAVRGRAERQGITAAAVQSIFASFAGKFTAKAITRASANAGAEAMTAKLAAGAPASEALAAFDVAEQAATPVLSARAGATAADAGIQAAGMAGSQVAGQIAADRGGTENVSLGQAAVTGVEMLGYSLGETALGASRRALFHADPVEAAQQSTVMAADALKVEHDVQALAEIGTAVKAAKATSQVPDRLKSLVEMATGNNQDAKVYFQSADWDEFWQGQGASPAQAYDEIVGDGGKGYYEAKSTGSRLVIPIADYIAKVAPTDHWEGLLEHARTSVDGMSLGEAQEYLTSLPATLTEIANEANGEKPAAAPAEKPTIGARVQAQLEAANVPTAQAKAHGALYEAAFTTLGQRAGVDPHDLFDRYALEVTNEKQPALKTTESTRPVSPEEAERRANLAAAAESALERLGFRDEEVTAKGTYDLGQDERNADLKNDAGEWIYARTKAGVIRSNLSKISTEGMVDEIARLHEANNADAAKVVPSVSDEANVSHRDGYLAHHVSIKGEGINASGRIKQRAKAIERLEAHLAERVGSPEAAQDLITARTAERDTGGFGRFYEQEARGRIRIGEDRHISIDLLKGADRSTFLHETGHFYLEILQDLAGAENAPPDIAADFDALKRWFGRDPSQEYVDVPGESRAWSDPLTIAEHEQFARGFEAYLMEGKAPSTALSEAFQRFRTWLTGIYRQLRNLDVELTPEVRRVFDRLIATEDQIAAAEKTQAVEPLFDDPKAVGLSESQAEAYSRAVADARRTAEEEVTQRVMKEIKREESAQWKEWRAPIVDQMTEIIDAQPEYRALAFLKDGTNPDGSPLEEGTPTWKLEREAVRARYPDVSLPDGLTELSERGGMDPDIAAEVFGYQSGRDLVEALAKATPRKKLIESLADQRMLTEHGERLSEGDLRDAAVKAVRGEKRAQVLRKELEILASSDMAKLKGLVRAITKPVPPTDEVRRQAAQIIGAKTVSEIRPVVYERAAKKLATEAREALLKGDIEAAFDLKRKELLTTEVFRAATAAKEAVEAGLEEFKKVFRRDETLSKTRDIDLVNAARSILASYGIGRTDKSPIEYLEAIRRYDESTYETVRSLVAEAAEGARDYRTLSYDDFAAMRETVSSLWTLARRTRQVEIDGKRLDREFVQNELAGRLAQISTGGEKPGYKQAVTNWEKTKHYLMGAAPSCAAPSSGSMRSMRASRTVRLPQIHLESGLRGRDEVSDSRSARRSRSTSKS